MNIKNLYFLNYAKIYFNLIKVYNSKIIQDINQFKSILVSKIKIQSIKNICKLELELFFINGKINFN